MLQPKFEYGMEVRVIRNIRNDTHQGQHHKGALLVRRGRTGFVRQSGVYQQDQIIYQVHFLDSGSIIGCKESELIASSVPWFMNEFEYGDKANLAMGISVEGELVGVKGDVVDVLSVDRLVETDIRYRVQIGEHDVIVPERALLPGGEQ
jgi:nitrogen fixation protein NifZ